MAANKACDHVRESQGTESDNFHEYEALHFDLIAESVVDVKGVKNVLQARRYSQLPY